MARADWLCKPGGEPMQQSGLLTSQTQDYSTAKTVCMFGASHAPTLRRPGGCSKSNDALYDPAFADIVDDISMQEAVDGVAKCTLILNAPPPGPGPQQAGGPQAGGPQAGGPQQASVGKIRSYDAFLKQRAIELSDLYQRLKAAYEYTKQLYEKKKEEYERAKQETESLKSQADTCAISYNDARVAETRSREALAQCQADLSACQQTLAARQQELAARQQERRQERTVRRQARASDRFWNPLSRLARSRRRERFENSGGPQPRTNADGVVFIDYLPQETAHVDRVISKQKPMSMLPNAGRFATPPSRVAQSVAHTTSMVWAAREAETAGQQAGKPVIRKSPPLPPSVFLPRPVASGAYDPQSGLTQRVTANWVAQDSVGMQDPGCRVGTHVMTGAPLVRSDLKDADKRFVQCYMPASASDLVNAPGGCSKQNSKIFSGEFADLVTDVREDEAVEGVRKCVVTFASPGAYDFDGGPTSFDSALLRAGQRAKEYDSFLSRNIVLQSPEYNSLLRKYWDIQAKYEQMLWMYLEQVKAKVAESVRLGVCQANLKLTTAARAAADQQHAKCQEELARCKQSLNDLPKNDKPADVGPRPSTPPPPPPPPYAILYEHCGYKGRALAIRGPGQHSFPFKLSSIKVFNGAGVQLMTHDRSAQTTFNHDVSCLTTARINQKKTWNDHAGFAELVPAARHPYAVLYEHCDFRGSTIVLADGNERTFPFRLSSIKVFNGARVLLQSGDKKDAATFDADVRCLTEVRMRTKKIIGKISVNYSWNDRARSARLV